MKFFEILNDNINVLKTDWNGSPTIGDINESVVSITAYYGCDIDKISEVLEEGIYADNSGFITCSLEPNTAYIQLMRESIAEENRVVFRIELPTNILNHSLVENCQHDIDYGKWAKSDVEYYAMMNVKVKNHIPVTYIRNYMVK